MGSYYRGSSSSGGGGGGGSGDRYNPHTYYNPCKYACAVITIIIVMLYVCSNEQMYIRTVYVMVYECTV